MMPEKTEHFIMRLKAATKRPVWQSQYVNLPQALLVALMAVDTALDLAREGRTDELVRDLEQAQRFLGRAQDKIL